MIVRSTLPSLSCSSLPHSLFVDLATAKKCQLCRLKKTVSEEEDGDEEKDDNSRCEPEDDFMTTEKFYFSWRKCINC